jgi:hypothetical protein
MRNIKMSIKEELLKLREQIINESYIKQWKEVWFFHELNGIKGYQGTGEVGKERIIFIATNPSYGNSWPSKRIIGFYQVLKDSDLQNVHITDLIKVRLSNAGSKEYIKNPELLNPQIEYLKKEIEIIRPTKIIAFGTKVHDTLEKYGIESECLMHYAHAFRYNKEQKFRMELKEILKK